MTDDERDQLLKAIARHTADALLLIERLAPGLREDLGQLYGASLAIDGGVRRIEAIVAPKPRLVTDEEPGEREHTGRHELIGGVAVEIPDDTKRRAVNTWAVVKWLAGVALAGGGWLMHLLHALGGK